MTGGSLAMGVGIWSMHFIGMLAFSMPGLTIAYDVPLLILSILVAIIASALALVLISRDKVSVSSYVWGSSFMGAAIAGMHYIGIWSMRMSATIHWDFFYVVLSILIAYASSFVALLLAFKLKDDLTVRGFMYRGAGGVIMGFAIAGMHYTAMAAMHLTLNNELVINSEQLLATDGLAAAVIIGTLIILGIALSGSNIDRALNRKTLLNEILQDAIKARDDFFSVASHELKTPLTSVKLQTQLIMKQLEKEKVDPEKIKSVLNQTDQSVNQLTRLVDDMLDIARLQTGKLSLQPDRCRLDETLQEVVERLSPLMEEAKCEVIINQSEPLEGNWDKFRLEQVITNILTNAARYGEGKPIEVKLFRYDGWAVMSFKDQGKGIAREDQERIFQRFERAAQAHQTRALGLGLFIVKEIINMHLGEIRVESEIGKGSEFIVRLPLA